MKTAIAKRQQHAKAQAQQAARDSLVCVPLGMILDLRRLQANLGNYARGLAKQQPATITRDAKRIGRMEAFGMTAAKVKKILSENRVYQ